VIVTNREIENVISIVVSNKPFLYSLIIQVGIRAPNWRLFPRPLPPSANHRHYNHPSLKKVEEQKGASSTDGHNTRKSCHL